MKLLKLELHSPYKMLKEGFSVDFLTKTRIAKDADNEELFELEPGLYYPYETIFIGKNSSGKTTVLQLLSYIISFLGEGHLPQEMLVEEYRLSFEVLFYEKGFIYRYEGSFVKASLPREKFLLIEKETLQRTTYKSSYKKDLSNIYFPKENLLPVARGDMSDVRSFCSSDMSVLTDEISISEGNLITLVEMSLQTYGESIFDAIVRLFDDSVEYIKPFSQAGEKLGFLFKRIHRPEMVVSFDYLLRTLSSGTFRGIYLFLFSFLAFKKGGTIFVDEIEKSFNKNLIENLFLLFSDKEINVANATLVFSTHYAELLDHNGRSDNVNVLHRDGDEISLKNLSVDYGFSVHLLKSNYFHQNAFDNLQNYDYLMALRRAAKR